MALEQYSSRDVNVIWGETPLVGFAPDSFVTITPNADITDEEVGADGLLQTSINPDRTGTVSIVLQQNSPSNLILAGVLEDQLAGGRKFKKGTLVVADPSGAAMVFIRGAYIKSRPEITLGSTASGNTKTWVFFCEELVYTAAPALMGEDLKVEINTRVAAAIAALDALR